MRAVDIDEKYRPSSIWNYYTRSLEALAAYQAAVLSNPTAVPSLLGLIRQEVDQALADTRRELDDQVTMALIASYEAVLRTDFWAWVSRTRKGGLRSKFRALEQRYGDKVPLEEILEKWASVTGKTEAVGRMAQLVKYRHWLAHGRYWTQKSGIRPTPEQAWDTGTVVFAVLPGLEDALV